MSIRASWNKAILRKVLPIVSSSFFLAALLLPIQPCTPAHAEETGPQCWAVIVGVPAQQLAVKYFVDAGGNAYPLVVKYPDDSARDLAQQLGSIWGEDNIKLLLNSEATKIDIYYAIKWLADVANTDDTVLFYFCGHGYLPPYGNLSYLHAPKYVPRGTTPVYLCPYDCILQEKSVLSDIQVRYAISDSELDSWLSKLNSKKVVVILDTCHAGSFNDELGKDGRVILMGCQPQESSYEAPELEHGVFTHYILQALNNFGAADANHDYELSAEEVFNYAKPKTVNETIKPYANIPAWSDGDKQHPRLYDTLYSEELSLLTKAVFHTNARFPPDATVLTVDQKAYLSGELPASFTWAAGSVHTFDIPSQVDSGDGTRLVFTSWDDGDNSVSRVISSGGVYTANYKTQYRLTIESAYGSLKKQEWYYDSDSTATVAAAPVEGTIIRRVFTGWSGDFTGNKITASLTMDEPKTVTANWRSDYFRLYIFVAIIAALLGTAAVVITHIYRRKKAPESPE